IRATGSRTANIEDADFVIIPSGGSDGAILHAKRGSLEYPDTGATVIYVVEYLDDRDNGKTIALLKGPGIRNDIAPVIHGLGKNELSHIKEINSEFPLGIDCIFIESANKIMCIPRSTRIEVR
ncbi:MAG: phosphonate C-P lyase system protein PhnH, partial [Nitrospinae bacterium]|nr:phosphonate C-P lyase system protein PhnH [Nitrospinota bacterium]